MFFITQAINLSQDNSLLSPLYCFQIFPPILYFQALKRFGSIINIFSSPHWQISRARIESTPFFIRGLIQYSMFDSIYLLTAFLLSVFSHCTKKNKGNKNEKANFKYLLGIVQMINCCLTIYCFQYSHSFHPKIRKFRRKIHFPDMNQSRAGDPVPAD